MVPDETEGHNGSCSRDATGWSRPYHLLGDLGTMKKLGKETDRFDIEFTTPRIAQVVADIQTERKLGSLPLSPRFLALR